MIGHRLPCDSRSEPAEALYSPPVGSVSVRSAVVQEVLVVLTTSAAAADIMASYEYHATRS